MFFAFIPLFLPQLLSQSSDSELLKNATQGTISPVTGLTMDSTKIEESTVQKSSVTVIKSSSINEHILGGIKIKLPSAYEVYPDYTTKLLDKNCEKAECEFHIGFNGTDTPIKISTHPLSFLQNDGINSLLEFVKHQYLEKASPYFTYINDNQTVISNHTVINFEFIDSDGAELIYYLQNGDMIYTLSYIESDGFDIFENKKIYTEYLPEVKQIFNSIEFKNDYKSPDIQEETIPFYTNSTTSRERGYPSFITKTDLENPKIQNLINNTKNFRERYDEFIFNNSTIGLKLVYDPATWGIRTAGYFEDCYKAHCTVVLDNINFNKILSIWIKEIPPAEYTEKCNCNNAIDYLKTIYDKEWGIDSDSNYDFVKDGTISLDGHTVTKMEFIGKKDSDYEGDEMVFLITQVNDIFYTIEYWVNEDEKSLLPEIQKVIDSIKFIGFDKPKEPSFLSN